MGGQEGVEGKGQKGRQDVPFCPSLCHNVLGLSVDRFVCTKDLSSHIDSVFLFVCYENV